MVRTNTKMCARHLQILTFVKIALRDFDLHFEGQNLKMLISLKHYFGYLPTKDTIVKEKPNDLDLFFSR